MVRRAVAVLTGAFVLAMVGWVRPALAAPVISVTGASVTEGDSSNVTMFFSVRLSSQSSTVVDVRFTTSDGTATSADYAAVDTVVKFTIGQTTVNVPVTVKPDKVYEGNETFTVTLSNPGGGTIGTPTATGTIIENDPTPTISPADASATEGTSTGGTVEFILSITGQTAVDSEVTYSIKGASARSGVDFTPVSGTLTFPAGAKAMAISVPVIPDDMDEPNETFTLILSAPKHATLTASFATGTIVDDDTASVAWVDDISVSEGDSGTSTATITLNLDRRSGYGMVIPYVVQSGSAMADEDFIATSGAFVLPAEAPGPFTATVQILGDTIDEPDEHMFVRLSLVSNAYIPDPESLIVIADDDQRPSTTDAEPLAASVGPTPTTVNGSLRATLRDGVTLAPLPGRTITFTSAATSAFLCDAVTDALGRATCGDPEDIAFALADGGYRATFGGDSDYMASSGDGPVVTMGAAP